MAFAKTVMSLLGFLRFIPSSRFHAKEGEIAIDLSSASVLARQVMEDALSFFYLSERNLTQRTGKSVRAVVQDRRKASKKPDPPAQAKLVAPDKEETPQILRQNQVKEIFDGIINDALEGHSLDQMPEVSEPPTQKSDAEWIEEVKQVVLRCRQSVSPESWERILPIIAADIKALQGSREPDFNEAASAKIHEKLFQSLQKAGYAEPDKLLIDKASFYLNDLGINPLSWPPKTLGRWLRESALIIPTQL